MGLCLTKTNGSRAARPSGSTKDEKSSGQLGRQGRSSRETGPEVSSRRNAAYSQRGLSGAEEPLGRSNPEQLKQTIRKTSEAGEWRSEQADSLPTLEIPGRTFKSVFDLETSSPPGYSQSSSRSRSTEYLHWQSKSRKWTHKKRNTTRASIAHEEPTSRSRVAKYSGNTSSGPATIDQPRVHSPQILDQSRIGRSSQRRSSPTTTTSQSSLAQQPHSSSNKSDRRATRGSSPASPGNVLMAGSVQRQSLSPNSLSLDPLSVSQGRRDIVAPAGETAINALSGGLPEFFYTPQRRSLPAAAQRQGVALPVSSGAHSPLSRAHAIVSESPRNLHSTSQPDSLVSSMATSKAQQPLPSSNSPALQGLSPQQPRQRSRPEREHSQRRASVSKNEGTKRDKGAGISRQREQLARSESVQPASQAPPAPLLSPEQHGLQPNPGSLNFDRERADRNSSRTTRKAGDSASNLRLPRHSIDCLCELCDPVLSSEEQT
jgi:hypothetical protein